MSKKPLAALGLAVLVASGGHPFGAANASRQGYFSREPLVWTAEFPSQDVHLWRLQRAGLVRKMAANRVAQKSYTPGTVELLLEAGRVDAALQVIRRIVEHHPERIAPTFEIVARPPQRIYDDARSRDLLIVWREVIDEARKRLTSLPREDAARVARQLLFIDDRPPADGSRWPDTLRPLIQKYAGTQAASLAEIDLRDNSQPWSQRLEALDAAAKRLGTTVPGAKALYLKGHLLGTEPPELKGTDPVDRLRQVIEIVDQLESGRYPRCEWTRHASSLVVGFGAAEESWAAADRARLIDTLVGFARTRLELDPEYPAHSGLVRFLTSDLQRLLKSKREDTADIDAMLLRLQQGAGDPVAVRYLRALVYLRTTQWDATADRAGLLQRAREMLARVASEGPDLYHRKALASLAALEFAERNYRSARDHFSRYLKSYPQSEWAWVAALRVGQCDEALRNWKRAEESYRSASVKYASVPIARVLGREYAAGALEALGDFPGALRQHQQALDSWDDDYGAAYSSHETYPQRIEAITGVRKEGEIAKSHLAMRVEQLKRSLAVPSGVLLERGRWLLQNGGQRESLAPLEQLVAQHSTSPLQGDARQLLHRARFEIAMTRDPAAAMAELEVLAQKPLDVAVLAARLGHASLRWKRGAETEADSAVRVALQEWQTHRLETKPRAALEADIAEIRRVLFRPVGHAVRGPFQVVNPAIAVKLADGETRRFEIVQSFPTETNVLFFTAEEMDLLERMATRFGGTPRPNFVHPWTEQPRALWDKFFRRRTDWPITWEFQTYLVIREIEFLDAARTKAIVSTLDSPSSGAAVVVEKRGGTWIVGERLYRWNT